MKQLFLTILISVLILPSAAFAQTTATTTPKDTDGDGFSDEVELRYGYDPFSSDPTPLPKTIRVSLKKQQLSYYTGPHLVKEFKISGGLSKTPTPRGTFLIDKKVPVVHYKGEGYNYPGTKWNLRFKYMRNGSYYIHGAYWHNAFGRPRSHGCVNVSYKNMKDLYEWAPEGTPVIIE